MRLEKTKTRPFAMLFACCACSLAMFATGTNATDNLVSNADQTAHEHTGISQPLPALAGGGTLVPKRVRLIIGFHQTIPA